MLGSSHVRFAPELQQSNSYHYTNIYSYWMNWVILRDALSTACNIMSVAYKGWAGGLTMPLDIANQIVRTVGQTDGHSSPDHTTSQADVKWNINEPQATLLMPFKGLTASIMVLCDLTGSTKGCL